MEETANSCAWYDPSCGLAWLRDEFQAFSVWLWDSMLSGIASLFESIPVPEFMLNAGSHSIPAGVAWAAEPFQIPVGLGIIVSAYIARFILRRIPIIG